ncbi:MAG: hypothetical protein AAB662_04505 [Patescibacteria group bacterium]
MNKKNKILLSLVILVIVAFGLYIYKLHALAVEGNKIFEQRCLIVNPPLISYKNSFLKFADFLKNPDKYSSSEVKGFFDDYIAGMRKYITEETKWLESDRKYLDRWDFKLIEPWYIKQGGEIQWKLYEAYRDDARYILEPFDVGKITSENDIKQKEARDRRDNYSQMYFEFVDKATKISDWRKQFGNVPVPRGCTKENMRIPNTTGVLDGNDSLPPATAPVDETSPLI